jgi:hypothetical protein
MTRTRASAPRVLASAVAGVCALSAAVTAPIAHADPLDNIAARVNGTRASNGDCAPLHPDNRLYDNAEAYADTEDHDYTHNDNYKSTVGFLGSGDPQSKAIDSAYFKNAGVAIRDCKYTDFGVGFIRYDSRSVDVVTIVLGEPK